MLPTSGGAIPRSLHRCRVGCCCSCTLRSEEHTSELQSRLHLVCRLLLEKKKKHSTRQPTETLSTNTLKIHLPSRIVPPQPSTRTTYDSSSRVASAVSPSCRVWPVRAVRL